MKTRDQLLKAFCVAVDRDAMAKLVNEALDSLQFAELQQALAEARLKKAGEQIARQAKMIDELNQALAGPKRK
jgi:hypothetical protein